MVNNELRGARRPKTYLTGLLGALAGRLARKFALINLQVSQRRAAEVFAALELKLVGVLGPFQHGFAVVVVFECPERPECFALLLQGVFAEIPMATRH